MREASALACVLIMFVALPGYAHPPQQGSALRVSLIVDLSASSQSERLSEVAEHVSSLCRDGDEIRVWGFDRSIKDLSGGWIACEGSGGGAFASRLPRNRPHANYTNFHALLVKFEALLPPPPTPTTGHFRHVPIVVTDGVPDSAAELGAYPSRESVTIWRAVIKEQSPDLHEVSRKLNDHEGGVIVVLPTFCRGRAIQAEAEIVCEEVKQLWLDSQAHVEGDSGHEAVIRRLFARARRTGAHSHAGVLQRTPEKLRVGVLIDPPPSETPTFELSVGGFSLTPASQALGPGRFELRFDIPNETTGSAELKVGELRETLHIPPGDAWIVTGSADPIVPDDEAATFRLRAQNNTSWCLSLYSSGPLVLSGNHEIPEWGSGSLIAREGLLALGPGVTAALAGFLGTASVPLEVRAKAMLKRGGWPACEGEPLFEMSPARSVVRLDRFEGIRLVAALAASISAVGAVVAGLFATFRRPGGAKASTTWSFAGVTVTAVATCIFLPPAHLPSFAFAFVSLLAWTLVEFHRIPMRWLRRLIQLPLSLALDARDWLLND